MPIYAYRCDACGHAKDVLQKVSDPLLGTCPACGAEAFRKQLTAAGFQLKGSGWYVTDFRNGAGAKPAAAGEAVKPEAAGGAAPDSGAGPSKAPAADSGGDSGGNGSGGGSGSGGTQTAAAPAGGGCAGSCACH